MDPKKREDLLAEMRDLVDNLLIESLEDLGYPRDFSTLTGKPDLELFLNDMRQTFRSESESQVIRDLPSSEAIFLSRCRRGIPSLLERGRILWRRM